MKSKEQRAAWADLRTTRSNPPGAAAASPVRRSTYAAALQQAEELFEAGSSAGAASAPLSLFYGLSQAGRAIAAAAPVLTGPDWQLSGHGIKAQQLDGKLSDIRVFAVPKEPASSFVRLSTLLGSPVWTGTDAIGFAQVWNAVPGLAGHPIALAREARPPLLATPNSPLDGHPLVGAWISGIPALLADSGRTASDFRTFMSGYPTADGYTYVNDGDGYPDYQMDEGGTTVGVQMYWEAGERHPVPEQVRVARINQVVKPYSYGEFYLYPQLIAGQPPLHPLMAWWTVLYTLSMLARYHPAAWTAAIDVDKSAAATALEHVLTEAAATIPALVLQVLREVA